jgi:HSP20 family protein
MATLVRWEPFRELAALQSEMSRMLDGIAEPRGRAVAPVWAPALDVWETDTELVYAFDLPGVPEAAIRIEVADDTLTLIAERVREEEKSSDRFYRFERRYGSFSRAVGLPQGADEAKIAAVYKDGVVEIHVPKPEEQKPRRIPLGSAPADLEATVSSN